MVKFEYSGSSTEDILFGIPLLLVSNGSLDNIIGIQRSKLQSDITISRPVVNEYGAIGEHLVFSYSLIKANLESFTEEEQIAVERWLTSPKFSSELTITDDYNMQYSYYGLFTGTEWIPGNHGFVMCTFTFEVNGFYPFKHYSVRGTAAVYTAGVITGVNDSFDFNILCESDELEEYIYPQIIVTGIDNENPSFVLKNITDNNNTIEVTVDSSDPIYIDCQRCIIKKKHEDVFTNLKYSDIGWSDIGKIYWPKLSPGENRFHVDG